MQKVKEMNRREILKVLGDILSKYDKNIVELTEKSLINELTIEDLSKVQVVMEVERVFDIEFDIMYLEKIKTIQDLVEFIENYNS